MCMLFCNIAGCSVHGPIVNNFSSYSISIPWFAVQFVINCTSNAGDKLLKVKPNAICFPECITSVIVLQTMVSHINHC